MPASSRAHVELSGVEGIGLTEGVMTAEAPETFRLHGAHWVFGDVLLSDLTFTPVTIEQVPDLLEPDSETESHFNVGFVLEGTVTLDVAGIALPFGEGEAAFVANWSKISASNSERARVLYLSIPCAELHVYGIDPAYVFAPIDPGALQSDALLPFLRTLLPIIQNHSIPTEPTATILVRLVAGLFISDEAQLDMGDAHDRHLRQRADDVIVLESPDPHFGPATLADNLGVTEGELETAFERSGSGDTVQETIDSRRVAHAVELLGRPSGETAPSIRAAATDAGFTDNRALERAVRATYGVSVIELLAGLHRLNPADFPDLGGTQTAVSRFRGPDASRPRWRSGR